MGEDNNNAGIHFIKFSEYGKYDDLAYYDRNSQEGIQNRRNEALAQLEAMGEFTFTKYAMIINVLIAGEDLKYPVIYKVYLYEKEHENDIRRVSTTMRLCGNENKMNELIVRVHNEQRIIYLENDFYRDNLLSKNTEYILLR